MKIVAKFIGTNSLGYENGKEYGLIIKGLQITRLDGTGACPYESIESFFKNWIVVDTKYYLTPTKKLTKKVIDAASAAYAEKRHPGRWDGLPFGQAGRKNHRSAITISIKTAIKIMNY